MALQIGSSYFSNRSPRHVREDMKDLKEQGFTHVLHTVSEDDMAFYRQSMKEIADISHEEGLQVYVSPWSLANVFGGQALSKFVADHPDECQIDSKGRRFPGACLYSEKLKTLLYDWVDFVAYMGADVVFWDEPHWMLRTTTNEPDVWACRCERCKQAFASKLGKEMPMEETEEVKHFKHARMSDLLFELSAYAKTQGLQVAVCLLPILKTAADERQWEEIAAHPSIDIVATDPYSLLDGFEHPFTCSYYPQGTKVFVDHYSRKLKALCDRHGKEAQVWVQNFWVKQGLEDGIREAFETAYEAGIRNLFTWGYRGCEDMSFNRCERPDVAWNAFLDAVRQVTAQPKEVE